MSSSISRSERRWLLIVTIIALCAANLPSVLGFLAPPAGTQYTGITSTAPGDLNVYRSYLEQVSQGHLVFRDLFTSEPQVAKIISPFWIVLGLVGSLLHLSTLLTYYLARIFFGALLIWFIYWVASQLFEEVRIRKLALLLATFAAGLGAWVAPLAQAFVHGGNLERVWPMDLWVSEAFTFLSLHHSPHFLAGTILILLTVVCLASSLERRSTRDAVGAGLSMLALYSFHPFHVLSLGLTTLGFLVVAFIIRRDAFRYVLRCGLAWLIASPALAYQAWFALKDPLGASRASQNILYTPPLLTTVVSYGFLLGAAVWGAVVLWRKRTLRLRLLVTWAAAHALAIYLPIFFNRRVTQGLNIALALLAAVGVLAGLDTFRRKTGRRPHVVLLSILLWLGFGMSTVWVSAQDSSFLLETGRSLSHYFYLSNDYRDAFRWLKDHGRDDSVVLAGPITGNFIPGWSGRRVVIGHNVETVNFDERSREVREFFSTSTDAERQKLLRIHRVTLVVVGPWERRIGAFDATSATYLQSVFQTATVTIYRPRVN